MATPALLAAPLWAALLGAPAQAPPPPDSLAIALPASADPRRPAKARFDLRLDEGQRYRLWAEAYDCHSLAPNPAREVVLELWLGQQPLGQSRDETCCRIVQELELRAPQTASYRLEAYARDAGATCATARVERINP